MLAFIGRSLSPILMILVLCVPLLAQSVVTISEDGKQAWYTLSGTSLGILADRVIRLSGDSPLPPVDPPIDPPIDPPTNPDQWGLVALSESEAQSVQGDPNRNETANKIGIAYIAIGQEVKAHRIAPAQIKRTLDVAFLFQAGTAARSWAQWKDVTGKSYNDKKLEYGSGDAGQGIIDIGVGAVNSSTSAIGDGALLEMIRKFITEILPMILALIDLFSPAEVVEMLKSGMTLEQIKQSVLSAAREA